MLIRLQIILNNTLYDVLKYKINELLGLNSIKRIYISVANFEIEESKSLLFCTKKACLSKYRLVVYCFQSVISLLL
jgi:hypothetical protein